jgi:hypothetical protein
LFKNKEQSVTERNRAWRRAQKKRQKNKSRRIAKRNGWDIKRCMNSAATLASCSCWMCGNPRKYCKGSDKYTIQEQRQFESEKHYIHYVDPWDDDSYEYYLDWVEWNMTGYDPYDDLETHRDWWLDYISDSKE